jgi:hypothetical protein
MNVSQGTGLAQTVKYEVDQKEGTDPPEVELIVSPTIIKEAMSSKYHKKVRSGRKYHTLETSTIFTSTSCDIYFHFL